MAVKYRLIERKNLGNDKTETPKKQYAQVVYGDLVEFETFLEEVADGSGVGSAQVKAALSPRYSNIINCYHIFINSRIFRILRY